MVKLVDALKAQAKANFCAALGTNLGLLGNLEGVTGNIPLGDFYRRVNALVCDRPDDELELPPPPFEGGQCPVRYRVSTVIEQFGSCSSPPTPTTRTNVLYDGPLGAPFVRDTGGPGTRCPDAQGNVWSITANGEVANLSGIVGAGVGDLISIVVERQDGLPDDCGSLGPTLPPPGPVSIPTTVNYGDNNEFSLTVPVVFGVAYVSIDGSIEIPITIEDLNLVGELALNGDFEVNLNFGPNSPPNSGDDGPIGSPDPDGGDPEDEPEDERGLIVGVFVVVTSLPTDRATFIPQSVGPNIIAPRAGSVKFKVSADGRSGWTQDFPVKSSNAWIPVPGRLLASDVQVTPDFGAELSFRAVRERPQPT